jgi:hypothetical protein
VIEYACGVQTLLTSLVIESTRVRMEARVGYLEVMRASVGYLEVMRASVGYLEVMRASVGYLGRREQE